MEKAFPGVEEPSLNPVPADPRVVPHNFQFACDNNHQRMFVRFDGQVQMDNKIKKGSFNWSVVELPTAEARRRAWEYWKICYRMKALDGKKQRIGCEEGFGPLSELVDGKRYHGNNPNWEFTVWGGFAHSSKTSFTHRIHNRLIDTVEHQESILRKLHSF